MEYIVDGMSNNYNSDCSCFDDLCKCMTVGYCSKDFVTDDC